MFISFDGIDGCGKSTQIARVANILNLNSFKVKVTKDPGDNKISEQIRSILLNPENRELCDVSEFFLFLAARRQNYETVIKPHLDQGFVVLTDRYTPSTFAYQVMAKRLYDTLETSTYELVKIINYSGGILPDVSFVFDMNSNTASQRISNKLLDRIEKLGNSYFDLVSYVFYNMLNDKKSQYSSDRAISENFQHINANQDIENVTTEIITNLKQFEMFKNLQVG